EAGALEIRNTGKDHSQTALDCAIENQIAVLANRPLNAFLEDSLIRLVDARAPVPRVTLTEPLESVQHLEAEFRERLAPVLRQVSSTLAVDQLFDWGRQISAMSEEIRSFEQHRELEALIISRVAELVHALDQGIDGETQRRWSDWRDRYLPKLEL